MNKLIKSGFNKSQLQRRLHFAAHSHHPWPDVTEEAQHQFWLDSTQMLDAKWGHVFNKILPESRGYLRRLLNLNEKQFIIEGTSTFDLMSRLLSSFNLHKKFRILTTDSEFYSFSRLLKRFSEHNNIEIKIIPTAPFYDFNTRLEEALMQHEYDLIYISLVFFNSGFYGEQIVEKLHKYAKAEAVVVDGYHAFGAIPVNLLRPAEKIFFVGGGYKYLSAGEGACFMTVPSGCEFRPLMTGWYSDFANLHREQGEQVRYGDGGARFAGATFDPSGWYRFNAVQKWWSEVGLNVEKIHLHVRDLQNYFIRKMTSANSFNLSGHHGNFLCFDMESVDAAGALVKKLNEHNVTIDSRGSRIRIGFGYYHDETDVKLLLSILQSLNVRLDLKNLVQ